MSELNQTILKAIQDNLPLATAGELKKFIEQAAVDKLALENQLATTKTLSDKNAALTEQVNKLLALESREKTITETEKLLAQRLVEAQQNKELNAHTVMCANDKVNNMFDVLKLVFRSAPVGHAFHKTVNENNMVPLQTGGYLSTGSETKNLSENVTSREIHE